MKITGSYTDRDGWTRVQTFNPDAEAQGFSPTGELVFGWAADAPIQSEQGAFGGSSRDCTAASVVGCTEADAVARAKSAGFVPVRTRRVCRPTLGGWTPLPEWATATLDAS